MFLKSFKEYIPLIAYFVQIFLANLLFFAMLKKRKHFALRFSIGSILSLVIFLLLAPVVSKLLQGFIVGGRTTLSFLILLCLFYFCFDRKIIDTLYCSVAALLAQNMGANMYDIFRGILKLEGYQPLSIYMFISFIFIYVLTWLLCARKLKDLEDIAANKIVTLIVVVASYFLVCVFFMKISEYFTSKDEMFIYCHLIILVCDFFALFIMFSDLKKRYLITENMLIDQMMEDTKKRYKLESQTVEMINIKCHDLKHRLDNLHTNDEEDDKALEEVKQSIMIYESIAKTGNPVTDLIISNKALICEKNDIVFTYHIDGKSISFMHKTDISALFGNIIDNAIEYLSKVEPKENRVLNMNVFLNKRTVGMHVENFCDRKIEFKDGLPLSTKNDAFYHGFGTKSMKYIVNKYHGNMIIANKDNLYTIDIMMPLQEKSNKI